VRRKEGALPSLFLAGMARNGDHGEAIIDTAIIEIDAEIGTSASEA